MIKHTGVATIITGTHIEFFRMCTLRGALSLEIKGIKMSRGVSAYASIKKQYNLKGTKLRVLEQLEAMIEKFRTEHPATEA
jgi:hypothetical protein